MTAHLSLFGGAADVELPALVAPRVTAPVKAAPKPQALALDLFPEVGLFAEDAEQAPADEPVEAEVAEVAEGDAAEVEVEVVTGWDLAEGRVRTGRVLEVTNDTNPRVVYVRAEILGEPHPVAERIVSILEVDRRDAEYARALAEDTVAPLAEAFAECVPVGTPIELVDALAAQHAEEAPGTATAFRLLAEAAEALDARSFHILDTIEHDLTWREHEGHPMRQLDWLLLGMAEGRPRVSAR